MIKSFRDAEIQIEELRDSLNRTKASTALSVDESAVKAIVNRAISRIKIPDTPEQSNLFESIIIRRHVSGLNQPSLTIESTENTKIRFTRIADQSRMELMLNAAYNGSNFVQDDAAKASLVEIWRVHDTTDYLSYFSWGWVPAGSTSLTSLLKLEAVGNLSPTTDNVLELGKTGTRWKIIYAYDLTLTNPLTVANGGTGRNTLTTDYTLQGNAAGTVKLIAGIDNAESYVQALSVSTATLDYKDWSGSNASTTIVTSVSISDSSTLTFTKGVLTGAT